MNIKKTATAGALAVGMTVAVAGSPAQSAPDATADEAAAVAKAEQRLAKTQRALSNAEAKSDSVTVAKRRCVKKKKMRKIRVLMPAKKVMRKMPKPSRKSRSGSLKFRYWNACWRYGTHDFYVVLDRKNKKTKWRVQGITAHF